MLGRRKRENQEATVAQPIEIDVDPETGLMAAARFEECLDKEISRASRYGSKSALALFEVAVVEDSASGPAPSPAKFVAQILRKAARSSDVVARVAPGMFAVLLIEAHADGAKQFTERVRTGIGSQPYSRRADGSGIFARAWAGVAPWEPGLTSVEAYAGAAERALSSTFRGYEAAQDWFRGEGLNKPFLS